jgi:[acyl-carrier-protein] S-malonyltransferase
VTNIALLFPGQGAQAVGMGRGLLERSPSARSYFERASSVLGYDLFDVCTNGPDSRLNATDCSQPALFVHSMAALHSLIEQQPTLMDSVKAVAGLSLGEYSALSASGAIEFEEGVRLVQARGSAMQAAADLVPSGMASVIGLSREEVEAFCDQARLANEFLQVANLLCPGNIAISGSAASLDVAEKLASSSGVRFIRLPVAGAFHTDLMKPAAERLTLALSKAAMKPTTIPVYSNVDAQAHREPEDFRGLLAKQLVSPVRWEDCLRSLMAAGIDQFYEVGAGRVLAGTLKRIDRKVPCECIGD